MQILKIEGDCQTSIDKVRKLLHLEVLRDQLTPFDVPFGANKANEHECEYITIGPTR